MAQGKKTGGRDFEPGNPGGPGRPHLPSDLKEMQCLNRVELGRILNRLIFLKEQELRDLLESQDTASIEKVVASGLCKAIVEGDFGRLSLLLERLVGKVPQPIQYDITPEEIEEMRRCKATPKEEIEKRILELAKQIEERRSQESRNEGK